MRSEKEAEIQINEIKANTVDMEDTFLFGCKMCGDCCRKRSEAIILTGYDVYNIAKATNLTPLEVLTKYTECQRGTDSHLPIVYLKERFDGSCSLLRKGKCTIQKDKPVVCRLYPLGRYYDGSGHKYFKQRASCVGAGVEIKVKDWLEEFGIAELDEVSELWAQLITSAALYMLNIEKKNPKLAKDFYESCIIFFYCYYDMTKPAIDSLKKGVTYLEEKYKGFKVKNQLPTI